MGEKEALIEYIKLLAEARIREADISDGSKVAWGSEEHIRDLENRIFDLTRWRDRQRRGTEARANYARVVSQLKAQLRSAKNAAAKRQADEEQ